MWRMITQGYGGGVAGWGLLTIVAPIFSRTRQFCIWRSLIVALTIGLRLPWLTWYARLKIWLVRRHPIETVAIPADVAAAPAAPAQPTEEEIVPPQQVVVKAKSLDRQPVQATQLPLKIVKAEEVTAPPKIKRERVLPSLDLLEGHTSESIAQEKSPQEGSDRKHAAPVRPGSKGRARVARPGGDAVRRRTRLH
jgi:hypothetical protein